MTFESAGFNEGRIYSGGACYHIKDHLGSIRLVMDQTGSVKEQNDYYPFGMRQERSNYALFAGNRFKYNGKEEQTTGGLGYLDYGARMYDAESGHWFGVDPLLEKYYGLSPYVYCANNPLKYVDPDGRRFDDYFSFLGKYLGSDGKPTSYVRVTSEEEWEKNVKISTDGEKTIFQVDDAMNSVLHSESNINEAASLNIYDHYNMTGLPLINERHPDDFGGMAFSYSVARGNPKIKIRLNANMKNGDADNANNIINMFVHESAHCADYNVSMKIMEMLLKSTSDKIQSMGRAIYKSIDGDLKERRAFNVQTSHDSYLNTTKLYRERVNRYMGEKNYIYPLSVIKLPIIGVN